MDWARHVMTCLAVLVALGSARLGTAGERPELARQGEGEEEVGHGQQRVSLLLKPVQRLVVLAFGTVAVAAGMVAVLGLVAGGAVIDVSTQGRRTAALDGAHGLALAGRHALVEPSPVLATVLVEDGGQLYHARSAISRSIASTAVPSDVGVRCR